MKRRWALAALTGLGALAVTQASANLIVNGDFAQGNFGFSSAYTYAGTAGTPAPFSGNPNTLWDEGTYSVGTDPNLFHYLWASFGASPGNGSANMMLVNGAGSPVTVWSEDLSGSLVVNQTYKISADVANLYPPPVGSGTTPIAPAELKFSVDGTTLGTFIAPGVGVWSTFSTTFTWTGQTPIGVLDLVTTPGGNDFALDNISLTAVPEPTTMIAGALLLLPFGASTIRILRKKVAA
jgi:hypothetical protein